MLPFYSAPTVACLFGAIAGPGYVDVLDSPSFRRNLSRPLQTAHLRLFACDHASDHPGRRARPGLSRRGLGRCRDRSDDDDAGGRERPYHASLSRHTSLRCVLSDLTGKSQRRISQVPWQTPIWEERATSHLVPGRGGRFFGGAEFCRHELPEHRKGYRRSRNERGKLGRPSARRVSLAFSSPFTVMGGRSALLLREKAGRTQEVLASIGRGLREQYDAAPQLLSQRLAELVRKIEQPINETGTEDAPRAM
jgi:hypothetical protein